MCANHKKKLFSLFKYSEVFQKTILSKGRKISPVDMFDGYYFKKMGDYALLTFLVFGGMIGTFFILLNSVGIYVALTAFVPMIVLYYSWIIAGQLCLDKDLDPIESIYLSNKLTYGKKGTMFAGMLLSQLPGLKRERDGHSKFAPGTD